MKLNEMTPRKCDGHGCGHWHAPRGKRVHEGVDLECIPGTPVDSPVQGTVTKLGIVYVDDHHWRYVQVSSEGYDFRLFYVDPVVEVGQIVSAGSMLGRLQRLGTRYERITEHVHFEIKNSEGEAIDPTPVLLALKGG